MATPVSVSQDTIANSEALDRAYKKTQDGVMSVARENIIVFKGAENTADKGTLNSILAACAAEIRRGDAEQEPEIFSIAANSMKPAGAAGGADGEEGRAMDAIIEATILYNWRCSNRNGMILQDHRLVLANAITVRGPRIGDFELPGPLSLDEDQQGTKRVRERENEAAGSVVGSESPSAANAARSEELGENLTRTSTRLKFKAAFSTFTAHCIDFPDARFHDTSTVAAKVLEAWHLLKSLVEMARHPTLSLELPIVRELEYGTRECIREKQPKKAALYIAGELSDSHKEEGEVDKAAVQAKLKALRSSGGSKYGDREFDGWHLPDLALTSLPSSPVAVAGQHFNPFGFFGGRGFHSSGQGAQPRGLASGGGAGSTGYYGPGAQAGRGSGPQRGRGSSGRGGRGRGTRPICGACSSKGLAADHSRRVCPQTSCYHCHQKGHIQANCPNP